MNKIIISVEAQTKDDSDLYQRIELMLYKLLSQNFVENAENSTSFIQLMLPKQVNTLRITKNRNLQATLSIGKWKFTNSMGK